MKIRTFLFSLAALAVASSITSCEKVKGRGDSVVETRSVGGFTTIELALHATVYYRMDSLYSCTVEAQENLQKYIQTNQEGGRLLLRIRPGIVFGKHNPIIIRITAPQVQDLSVSGSGDINVEGTWSGHELFTSISGSGRVNISAMDADNYTVRISGSGSVFADAGFADIEDLNISGSGNIDLRHVTAIRTTAVISGSGNIYTMVSELLDGTISGSGSIYYIGEPIVNAHITGSGKIVRL